MIDPAQIPPEVVEAAARAAYDQWRHECAVADEEPVSNWREWDDLELAEQLGWVEQARAAIAAALSAWPGMLTEWNTRSRGKAEEIILPLSQEARDE